MKKIITALIILLGIQLNVSANSIDRTILQSGINKGAVSVSVKDVSNGKIIYRLNDKSPKNPASTLKIITLSAAIDTLGKDYNFSTQMYKSVNNDIYIKLGANPFFTSNSLKQLFETAKSKNIVTPKTIYIDNSIFDNVEWGEGWQWDDDLNPLMPKFSAYNIDRNLLNISIIPSAKGKPAKIITEKFYPITFMNLVTTGNGNEITISRNNNISPDIINIEGVINKKNTITIPVNNPKLYFKLRTEDAIRSAKIEYYGKLLTGKTPTTNIYLVDECETSISQAIDAILKDSDNLAAETVFKLAGAKYTQSTGKLENSQKMLTNYFEKIELNADSIKIVDGSGVSKNNLVTADFMTEFLIKIHENEFINVFAKAGEGTLVDRMLYFKDNLKAKTGTLSDVSTIAGYITSRKGRTYAFDIMINDPKSSSQDKKSLEEYILREIYSNY